MTDKITINEVELSIDDPCAIVKQLKIAKLKVALGETVSMNRFGDDEVRFTEANLKGLETAIADFENQCALKQGKRRRSARRVFWN